MLTQIEGEIFLHALRAKYPELEFNIKERAGLDYIAVHYWGRYTYLFSERDIDVFESTYKLLKEK